MKNNNSTSLIIFMGMIVLGVFTTVSIINIVPRNNQSDSYYAKVDNGTSAKIENLTVINNRLNITTSSDAVYCCVKLTKSIPTNDNICWKKIEDNFLSVSVYSNKKYYIWVKDNNGNISNYTSININN